MTVLAAAFPGAIQSVFYLIAVVPGVFGLVLIAAGIGVIKKFKGKPEDHRPE